MSQGSQGIEMIGKPLGPHLAGHVLDLKPSQFLPHLWSGSLFPLFVATKSRHSDPVITLLQNSLALCGWSNRPNFPRSVLITITVSCCMDASSIRPCWVSICHGLKNGPSPPRCWSPCSWTAIWPRTRRSSPGVPILWWCFMIPCNLPMAVKRVRKTHQHNFLVVGSSMETSWISWLV